MQKHITNSLNYYHNGTNFGSSFRGFGAPQVATQYAASQGMRKVFGDARAVAKNVQSAQHAVSQG